MSNALVEAMARVNAAFKGNFVAKVLDIPESVGLSRIPTGIFSLDLTMGGGVPVGKVITAIGEPSSGKTFIGMRMIAAFQRYCRNCGKPLELWDEMAQLRTRVACCKKPERMICALYDAEESWDADWATRVGVVVDEVVIIQPPYAEVGVDACSALLQTGEVDFLLVDSIAFLRPTVEVTSPTEESKMGALGKIMSRFVGKVAAAMASLGVGVRKPTVVFLNSWRDKIGIVYGDPRYAPGGKSVGVFSHMILHVKKAGMTGPDGKPDGQEIEVFTAKNKTFAPLRTARFSVAFRPPNMTRAAMSTDHALQVVRHATAAGLVEIAGSWYTIDGNRMQGEARAAEFYEQPENRDKLAHLEAEVVAREGAWSHEIALATERKRGRKKKDETED